MSIMSKFFRSGDSRELKVSYEIPVLEELNANIMVDFVVRCQEILTEEIVKDIKERVKAEVLAKLDIQAVTNAVILGIARNIQGRL